MISCGLWTPDPDRSDFGDDVFVKFKVEPHANDTKMFCAVQDS